MKLKIESDTTDETNLSKTLKQNDLYPITNKINRIKKIAEIILKSQKSELGFVNYTKEEQIKYSKTFILVTIIQLVILILLALYHIYSFRKYLLKNYYIKG